MNSVKIKRIYEKAAIDDGYRMLVDRLWPRGLTKENAAIDEWNKAIAPLPELRRWFGHKPEKFKRFSPSVIRLCRKFNSVSYSDFIKLARSSEFDILLVVMALQLSFKATS